MEPIGGRTLDRAVATVGVLVYRGVSTAEIDVPVTRLADRLGASVLFIGVNDDPCPGVEPARLVLVDRTVLEHVLPDVLVVPGGLGWRQMADDVTVARWLADASRHARGVLAMSTGTLLLAAAGELSGFEATGHWLARRELAALGATVSAARTVDADAGRLVTATGAMAALQVIDDWADQLAWGQR